MITPAKALAGRRESALLDLPSVAHMAHILAARVRQPSWIRTSIASLDRFRVLTGEHDLEALLARARDDAGVAERSMARYAAALAAFADTQIAGLAMGPKLWFRLNGVAVTWRPLTDVATRPDDPQARHSLDRLVLLALIGSGLSLSELLRLRIGDVGALDADGQLIPDPLAEPLAVRYIPLRGKPRPYITFVTFGARAALLDHFARRASAGQPLDPDAPLIARRDGRPATLSSVAYARRRNQALIRAGNQVNVSMCRATGDFFRAWGMPGARFAERQQLETSRS